MKSRLHPPRRGKRRLDSQRRVASSTPSPGSFTPSKNPIPPTENVAFIRTSMECIHKDLEHIYRYAMTFSEYRISLIDNLPDDEYTDLNKFCQTLRQTQQYSPIIYILPPSSLTHELDTREWCEETGLPPPSIQPNGTCRNRSDCLRKIAKCQFAAYPELANTYLAHHATREGVIKDILICGECRRIAHNRLPLCTQPQTTRPKPHRKVYKYGENYRKGHLQSRGSLYRHSIRQFWTPACRNCDRKQKACHPTGYEGCRCYKEQYLNRWLCWRCDDIVLRNLISKTPGPRVIASKHERVARFLHHEQVFYSKHPNGGVCCPCGRTIQPTTKSNIPITKQCRRCGEFVVPRTSNNGLRRSARLIEKAKAVR